MSTHSVIRNAILNGLDVSYKKLFIGPVEFEGVRYIQVHSDRHDINYSNFFPEEKIGQAVFKFLELEKDYKISEKKHNCKFDNFYNWTN